MPRVKRGISHLKKRKNLLKNVKGYKWGRKSHIKLAKVAVLKAGVYAYIGRKHKKRAFRRQWQIVLNAAVRPYGLTYSKFIHALKEQNIELDRKVLNQLAKDHPLVFKNIVETVRDRAQAIVSTLTSSQTPSLK
jgi:large subunit ribosomal protein L20